ncbi:unnamed protein product [Anisakis simplex]|uniref:ACAS_N domain-containing protein n=1 Tax=Anisakis simplex TaxID=6269 RepID=A0A0M3K438_ANISI|nr:unnamed protein product [Anisakis simplex]
MTVMGLLPLARLPGSTWQLVARRCAPILKKQLPTTAAVVHDGHHQSKRHLYTEGLKSYNQMYGSSIHDKDNFWRTVAGHLHFKTPSDKVCCFHLRRNSLSFFF